MSEATPAPQKQFSVIRVIVLFIVILAILAGFGAYRMMIAKARAAGDTSAGAGGVVNTIVHKNYRAYNAKVDAKQGWQIFPDAVVKPGERVVVHASGSWKVGPSHPMVGPEGEAGAKPGLVDWRISDVGNLGQLLAGVGPKPQLIYACKADGSFTAPAAGPLVFSINDNEPSNNEGQMSLTIEVYEQ